VPDVGNSVGIRSGVQDRIGRRLTPWASASCSTATGHGRGTYTLARRRANRKQLSAVRGWERGPGGAVRVRGDFHCRGPTEQKVTKKSIGGFPAEIKWVSEHR
jgi:hypothetical protein